MARTPARRGRGRPASAARPSGSSRAELLVAAEEVFSERGYGGASVEEVIRRAGLSKGTFYWNFSGKEDLFLSLVEDRVDRPAREAIAELTDAPLDARPSAELSESLGRLFASERAVVLLLHELALLAARDEAVAERCRQRHEARRAFLVSILEARHAQTGVPLSVPANDLAEAFLALADGLALRAIVAPGTVRPSLFGDVVSLVYDGLVHRSAL